MPTFRQGDVVRVPFPYTDRNVRQRRPAIVISKGGVGDQAAFLWVLMITSADNRSWPADVPFGGAYRDVGLPAPSTVRTAKIATIEASAAEVIGRADDKMLARVRSAIRDMI
ncbi:MAG: type II toxin-antitoxin system PemK/MazF family toxin [Alphaproteobacteria bacterium]|nr:type II toxin-antitoxin system PemK/MazF family toxin [Alphaproteobacteria bacterium]MBU1539902.1 type II toxin-antitoxin system PemK/MazF family toxin [Alphaproteobacteria bacterium]MBU2378594.1 type II toxin-antitoxin system PemK/MazF family toxin [Alphaproteobacteria bacterium]